MIRLCWLLPLLGAWDASVAASRPNIVAILADDMGWSDIGCYGGEIRTPNLDALAKGGLRFTQFYNTARCCPTRASLLTGLYPHQAGVGHMMEDKGCDGYRGELSASCPTIAEVLRPAGYATFMTGKWHLTRHTAAEGPKDNWPLQRGFDRFFGTIMGGGSYFDPASLTRDNAPIAPGSADFYYTDAIADNAARFVAEHRAKSPDRPFFLYVAFTAPHWPMHAKPQDIARYQGRYDNGWDAVRAARHKRQLAMGLVKRPWAMTPRDANSRDWSDIKNKEWFARRMEVYAAMVDCLDQGVGRIVAALRVTGALDETLVCFLSDNGGCAEEIGSQPKPPGKTQAAAPAAPMRPDELQTKLFPTHARDGRPVRMGFGVMPGGADTYLSYGLPWANASNTPFREYKHWVHEGGISTPLIAHWPKGIASSRRGRLVHSPGHLIDLMATCVDLAGAPFPREHGGRPTTPPEGVSLRPAFAGKPLPRAHPIFWEHEGNRAVREGQWKLVAKHDKPWELYDMEADRTELHDLAARHPEKVQALAAKWDAWAQRSNVRPWPPGGRRRK
jgi:arylsulfatase